MSNLIRRVYNEFLYWEVKVSIDEINKQIIYSDRCVLRNHRFEYSSDPLWCFFQKYATDRK